MKEITRIFDFPYYQLEKFPLEKCLTTKYNGKWVSLSTSEYLEKANAISRGLLRMGIKENDKIAVISSTNRTEWNIVDIGILQTKAQNVPIYPTISKEDYAYILNHSEAVYCFASDIEIVNKLKQIEGQTKLKGVFTFDEIEGFKNWQEVMDLGADKSNQDEVDKRKKEVQPNDLATLIYTSGTTGRPKGVMLSHDNLVSNVLASKKRVPLEAGKSRALSFLPVCHVFERQILYLYQYYGIEIFFAEAIDKIKDNLLEVRPHVMTAVPRLYEKVYDGIYAKGNALSGIKKSLFMWALKLGLKYEPYGANGWWYEFRLKIARKLIFSKWQAGLGGRLKLMVSGSAPLQARLTRVFAAAGIPIMEGYGLTETSPVVTVNDVNDRGFRIGTVGRVIDKVTVKIADDGEILVKGPNVMLGYFNDQTKTDEVIKNGFFHTGDIGKIDSDGFLKITDRKKEIFKTSGGKYIAPTVIENQLKQSLFIEQVMIIGEGEKMPAAFIQPNFEYLEKWCSTEKIEIKDWHDMAGKPEVLERIQQEVNLCNEKFGKWERIKKFALTPEIWSIEAGHLTPTLKMKRRVIKKIYNDLYDKIYRE